MAQQNMLVLAMYKSCLFIYIRNAISDDDKIKSRYLPDEKYPFSQKKW